MENTSIAQHTEPVEGKKNNMQNKEIQVLNSSGTSPQSVSKFNKYKNKMEQKPTKVNPVSNVKLIYK